MMGTVLTYIYAAFYILGIGKSVESDGIPTPKELMKDIGTGQYEKRFIDMSKDPAYAMKPLAWVRMEIAKLIHAEVWVAARRPFSRRTTLLMNSYLPRVPRPVLYLGSFIPTVML